MTNDDHQHNGRIILDEIMRPDEPSPPPWFTEQSTPWLIERMTGDIWYFGLLLDTGHVLCISHISAIWRGDGGIWLDVDLLDELPFTTKDHLSRHQHLKFITAPTSRCQASVQASKIIAAFELADS